MSDVRELPEGFTLETATTKAGGVAYEVEFPQAESLDAVREFYESEGKNPDEVILAIWNAGNAQGAKQGNKNPVRDATTDEERQEAIESHQEKARGFIQGAPRGGGGGSTHKTGLSKAKREQFGSAITTEVAETGVYPDEARSREIAEELGIDFDALMGR